MKMEELGSHKLKGRVGEQGICEGIMTKGQNEDQRDHIVIQVPKKYKTRPLSASRNLFNYSVSLRTHPW